MSEGKQGATSPAVPHLLTRWITQAIGHPGPSQVSHRPIYEHLFDKRAIESLQGAAKGLLEAFR